MEAVPRHTKIPNLLARKICRALILDDEGAETPLRRRLQPLVGQPQRQPPRTCNATGTETSAPAQRPLTRRCGTRWRRGSVGTETAPVKAVEDRQATSATMRCERDEVKILGFAGPANLRRFGKTTAPRSNVGGGTAFEA